jgi:hypothetical protein
MDLKLIAMKTLFTLLLLGFWIRPSSPPDVYHCTNGMISFLSWAPMETIDATSMELHSTLDTRTGEVIFSLPVSSFQFRNPKMQIDFNEDFMETDRFPSAIYKGKIQDIISWNKDGQCKIISAGVMTIHNLSRPRTDTATLTITNSQISIEGHFKVRVSDYGIKIPAILNKNISEEIYVLFGCSYKPYWKEEIY